MLKMPNTPNTSKPMDCQAAGRAMPDLLLEPEAAPTEARAHVAGCRGCRAEMDAIESTMGLLSEWEAPEPSPYWAARMGARLREEQAAPRRGWAGLRERMRTRLWLSDRSLRPAAGVAALGLVLAAGGGAWFDLQQHAAAPAAQASNTVRDLQSLEENAQVFQQISSLDEPDGSAQAN